jgi:hypothetical protein
MTRDEKERLTVLEVKFDQHNDNFREFRSDVSAALKDMRGDLKLLLENRAERRGVIGWIKTVLALLAPLISGAGGILVGRSH